VRLRTAQGKLKIEHSMVEGLREVLERLLAGNPAIRAVIPGVIRPVRDARGPVKIRVTVPTANGWKAIALSAGARQELFISTALGREELEQAIRRALEP
jgi:hypothetical protein